MSHRLSDEMRRCLDEYSSCQQICVEAVSHSLKRGGADAKSGAHPHLARLRGGMRNERELPASAPSLMLIDVAVHDHFAPLTCRSDAIEHPPRTT